MAKTVVGLFKDFDEAQAIVEELMQTGFSFDTISVIARDEAAIRDETTDAEEQPKDKPVKERITKGAVAGGAVGGVAGLAATAAGFTLPVIGPTLAAGPITALLGAVVGALTGGLIGGLMRMGVPEKEANYYAEGVRRGGALVTVETDDDSAEKAAALMRRHGAIDIDRLAEGWKAEGWTNFDSSETVTPVITEELLIGNCAMERGYVRVFDYVVEAPAEEEIEPQTTPEQIADKARQTEVEAERRRPGTSGQYSGPERRQYAQL
jgi:uncharacterized membrane protein